MTEARIHDWSTPTRRARMREGAKDMRKAMLFLFVAAASVGLAGGFEFEARPDGIYPDAPAVAAPRPAEADLQAVAATEADLSSARLDQPDGRYEARKDPR